MFQKVEKIKESHCKKVQKLIFYHLKTVTIKFTNFNALKSSGLYAVKNVRKLKYKQICGRIKETTKKITLYVNNFTNILINIYFLLISHQNVIIFHFIPSLFAMQMCYSTVRQIFANS